MGSFLYSNFVNCSTLSENFKAFVGHEATHAGLMPLVIRFLHNVHFSEVTGMKKAYNFPSVISGSVSKTFMRHSFNGMLCSCLQATSHA